METCICAAVKTTDGQIITGKRHNDCLKLIAARDLERLKTPNAQGFLTSTGRFVTRKEGLQLQQAAGIPSVSGKYRNNELYSEDLY